MTREEAIRRIKAWNLDSDDMEVLSVVIPELVESEDERIRKEIIDHLVREVGLYPGVDRKEHKWLRWLEKLKDASYAIEAVDRIDKYIDKHVANAHDMEDSNPDKKYYQGRDDALGKMAGILQDVYSREKKEESLKDFIDNFPYSDEQKEQDNCPEYCVRSHCIDCPIYEKQKEQKDYNKLYEDVAKSEWFKKAYEGKSLGWDNEQKEQEPAEWSDDDKYLLTETVQHLEELIRIDKARHCGVNVQYYQRNIDWLKYLPERFALQRRQEWSEEDERIVRFYEADYNNQIGDMSMKDVIDMRLKFKNWLVNRLKDIRPQSKKNDTITLNKTFFQWIYDRLVNVHNENPNVDYMISFKRRIEELPANKPSWKPSKEQMEALKECGECKRCLKELYEQLKQL